MDEYQRFRWGEERRMRDEENLAQVVVEVFVAILALAACVAFVWELAIIFN